MPPFGFGLSIANLRGGGAAPFVPTVLVTENWAGSGLVNGKVPTTGGGTWAASASMSYSGGFAGPGGQLFPTPTAYHSATYTDARFIGFVRPGATGPNQNQPLYIYARGDVNNAVPSNCYYIACNSQTNSSTNGIVLYKRISGVDTTLGTLDIYVQDQTVGLEVSGSAIKVYYNGTVAISVTDTAITTAGYWGFGLTYGENGEDTGDSSIGAITIQTA
jgi:hypothetical protein